MNISSTELFPDIHKLHKAIKQMQINRRSTKVQSWMNQMFELILKSDSTDEEVGKS